MTTQRVAVVTGGGRGIGKASALALNRAGWTVVVAGRTPETLDETVSQLDGGLAVPTDVADPDAVDALFEATVDALSLIHI